MADELTLAGEWQDTGEAAEVVAVETPTSPVEHDVDLTLSREELEAEAFSEGETNVVLADLEAQDVLTLDDLKRLPEARGVSDDELLELAVAAGLKVAGAELVPAAEVRPATNRPWKWYGKDGKETTDLAKVSAADFLAGQIGYRAINADQKRTFDEIVRLAQLGHHNEQRMAQVMSDRNMLAEQVQTAGSEVARANQERQAWNAILADQTGSSFLRAQEKYFAALAQAPTTTGPSQAEVNAQGVIFYQSNIFPALQKISAAYPGSNLSEIDKMAQYLIGQEPLAAMPKDQAWERIKYIINSQIPAMLEEAGYGLAGAPAPTNVVPSINTRPGPTAAGVAASPKSVAEQKKLLAENANLKRALAKQKLAAAPSLGGRGHGGEPLDTDDASSNLEKRLAGMSSSQAKEFLRSL